MLLVHEIIHAAAREKKKADTIQILQNHESWALKDILRGSYDTNIVWNIPSGIPPYEANKIDSIPSSLSRQNSKFRYFVKGGPGDSMLKAKREKLYVQLLESIHPADAEIVLNMIQKKAIKGITRNTVMEAFPGLLSDS